MTKRRGEDVAKDLERLRAALEKRPMTLAQVAAKLGGVDESTARRYLRRLTVVRSGYDPVRYALI